MASVKNALIKRLDDSVFNCAYSVQLCEELCEQETEYLTEIVQKVLIRCTSTTLDGDQYEVLFRYLEVLTKTIRISALDVNFDIFNVFVQTPNIDTRAMIRNVLINILPFDDNMVKLLIKTLLTISKRSRTGETELLVALVVSFLDVNRKCFVKTFLDIVRANRSALKTFVADVILEVCMAPGHDNTVFSHHQIFTYLMEMIRESQRKEDSLSRLLLAFLVVSMDSISIVKTYMEELFLTAKRLMYTLMPEIVGHSDLKYFIFTFLRFLYLVFRDVFSHRMLEWSTNDPKIKKFADMVFQAGEPGGIEFIPEKWESRYLSNKEVLLNFCPIGIQEKKIHRPKSPIGLPQSFDDVGTPRNLIMELLNMNNTPDGQEGIDIQTAGRYGDRRSPSSGGSSEESPGHSLGTNSSGHSSGLHYSELLTQKRSSESLAEKFRNDLVPEFLFNLNALMMEYGLLAKVEKRAEVLENLLIFERYMSKALLRRLREMETQTSGKSELPSTKKKLERSEERNSALLKEVKEYTKKLKETEQQLKRWNRDTMEMITFWRTKSQTSEDRLEELETKVSRLENDKSVLSAKNKDLEKRLHELDSRVLKEQHAVHVYNVEAEKNSRENVEVSLPELEKVKLDQDPVVDGLLKKIEDLREDLRRANTAKVTDTSNQPTSGVDERLKQEVELTRMKERLKMEVSKYSRAMSIIDRLRNDLLSEQIGRRIVASPTRLIEYPPSPKTSGNVSTGTASGEYSPKSSGIFPMDWEEGASPEFRTPHGNPSFLAEKLREEEMRNVK